GLVPGRMPASVDEVEAWLRLPVALAQIPLQPGVVVLVAEVGHARVCTKGVLEFAPLNRDAGLREAIQVAGMIVVKVRKDHVSDIFETHAEGRELGFEQMRLFHYGR